MEEKRNPPAPLPECLLNPFMVVAAKNSQTMHSFESIWMRNVNKNIANNSPSNILSEHVQFRSYYQMDYGSGS